MSDRDRDREPDEIPDWVETVTRVAGTLGFNKVRVRWKLQGWVNRRRAAARRDDQAAAHVRYQHRVCRHCHAVNDRDEKVCTRCGQPLGSRAAEMLGRLGISAPRALSVGSLVGAILVAVYVRIYAAGGGGAITLPIDALIVHGGSVPLGANDGELWRLTTAVLLHAGLVHLAFNLFALASIAPVAEDRFGRGVTLVLFLVTGTAGALISAMLGPPAVGVGASGAIMGLVGAVAGAGHRAGTAAGRAQRDDMIKWIIYVFLFGFIVGADNYAHGGGLVAGAAFGLLVPTQALTRAKARRVQIAIGAVGVAGLLAATVAIMVPLQGDLTIPMPRPDDLAGDPWPTGDPGDPDDVGTMLWLCSDRVTEDDYAAFGGKAGVAQICAALEELRNSCRGIVEPSMSADCEDLRRLDGTWPAQR